MVKKLGFTESKLVLKGNNLKSSVDYYEFIEKYPTLNLPRNAESKFHRTGEWRGWYDFLSLDKPNPYRVKKLSYNQAKKLVRQLKIKSSIEYYNLKKQNKLPLELPYTPKVTYKKQWKGWHIFLGTNPTTQLRKWASYEKCRKWARENNIKTEQEYRDAKRPINIPSDPRRIYS